MPLDPSIPLGVKTPDPFSALQQPIQTAATLQGLRQNQTRLNANQAISDAYAQSVDPNTGEVDFGKLQALASQNGAGAFLPEFMGQIAQQRNSQLTYETGQLDKALKQQQAVRGTIGSMALDPNLGKTDMSRSIAQQIVGLVQNGILPQDQAVRELKSIPGDPALQAAWVRNHLMNSLSGEAKIQAMMPKLVTANTGQGTAFFNQNPLTGEMTPNGFVAQGMTQAELAAPKTITMPDGSQRQVTTAQWLQMMNGGAPSGQQPSAGGDYTGRYPSGGGTGSAPGTLSSLSPAQQSALTSQGTTSNTAAQELHNSAADVPMRLNLLQQARDSLSGISTGPGSDWRNTASSFLNALAPDDARKFGWVGKWTNDVKDYDVFKKIMTNYASSISGSLGSGTDARLNAAVTGNANPNISKMANEDILAKTMAAEKMRAAQDYAFQNSGLTTDKFNQWQSQWNRAVDPQAFVYDSMSPKQRRALLDKLSPKQVETLKNNYNALVNQRIIQPGQ
jgi:hypothetical protein